MSDERDRTQDSAKTGGGFRFALIAVCFLLAYPLSLAPAFKFYQMRERFPPRPVMAFYGPIITLGSKSPTVDAILTWYGDLWRLRRVFEAFPVIHSDSL